MSTELEAPQHTPEADANAQGGSLLAAISNTMVRAMKQYYGKGPTKAKSYMIDNYLLVAMEGASRWSRRRYCVRASITSCASSARPSRTRWPGSSPSRSSA